MRKLLVMTTCLMLVAPVFAGNRWTTKELLTPTVDVPTDATMEQVKTSVMRALAARSWTVKDQGDDFIEAALYVRSHEAIIRISMDNSEIKINYVNSVDLNYTQKKGKEYIHRNYNRWVVNLQKDIDVFIGQNS